MVVWFGMRRIEMFSSLIDFLLSGGSFFDVCEGVVRVMGECVVLS